MKDIIKAGKISFFGLMAAIVLYPLLHELGHSFAAVAVGAEIMEINIFPIPSVLCDIGRVSVGGKIIIGLGGMILPFLVAVIINQKHFYMWYVCFTVRWICLLSFIISVISIVAYLMGKPVYNEDITRILQITPRYASLYIIVFVIFIVVDIVLIIKSKPLRRCIQYIE